MANPAADRDGVPPVYPVPVVDIRSEGGLRAPPGLSGWRKAWWWFDFIILVKLARLRFIGILLAIGIVIVKWDTLVAYYERWTRPESATGQVSSDVEYYCPMHPSVVRDNPKDKCPICFMPLSKRKKGESTDEALPAGVVARVQLSPYRVVLGGIKTWKVDYLPLAKDITTVGYVEFNERLQKQVAARVKGRLDELYVNETGQMVHAGDALASLYSPDLLVTVQNLLDAQRSRNTDLLSIAKDRLLLWGIAEDQIAEILKSGKANTHLKIRSPIDGHVIKKYVREGQYVEEGMPLYEVADLSTVWIQGQLYEDDLAFLPAQDQYHKRPVAKKDLLPVTATSPGLPNERVHGLMTFVHPHVDQATRTLTVRFELDNPGHRFRPGMTATVNIKVPPQDVPIFLKSVAEQWVMESAVEHVAQSLSGPGAIQLPTLGSLLRDAGRQTLLRQGRLMAVPESAVIDTGSQKIVYREEVPGTYVGIRVELGPRLIGTDDVAYFPVIRGLEQGDQVVTAGSFLVDAETRLNPAAGSIYFGGTGLNKDNQSSATVRPSTPEDEEAKINSVLARMNAADRKLVMTQRFCPVKQDTLLGSMGPPFKVMLKGQPVFLC